MTCKRYWGAAIALLLASACARPPARSPVQPAATLPPVQAALLADAQLLARYTYGLNEAAFPRLAPGGPRQHKLVGEGPPPLPAFVEPAATPAQDIRLPTGGRYVEVGVDGGFNNLELNRDGKLIYNLVARPLGPSAKPDGQLTIEEAGYQDGLRGFRSEAKFQLRPDGSYAYDQVLAEYFGTGAAPALRARAWHWDPDQGPTSYTIEFLEAGWTETGQVLLPTPGSVTKARENPFNPMADNYGQSELRDAAGNLLFRRVGGGVARVRYEFPGGRSYDIVYVPNNGHMSLIEAKAAGKIVGRGVLDYGEGRVVSIGLTTKEKLEEPFQVVASYGAAGASTEMAKLASNVFTLLPRQSGDWFLSRVLGSGVAGLKNTASFVGNKIQIDLSSQVTGQAQFNTPTGLAAYVFEGTVAIGLYVADMHNHSVRYVWGLKNAAYLPTDADNTLLDSLHALTMAGTGAPDAAPKGFNEPVALAVARDGTVYVGQREGRCVSLITPEREVVRLAGTGEAGYVDGPGSTALFGSVVALAFDGNNKLYVADGANHCIRAIDLLSPVHMVSTVAGNGTNGFADGEASRARFFFPSALAWDPARGALYIGEEKSGRIRRLDAGGQVSTVGGNGSLGARDGAAGLASVGAVSAICAEPDGSLVFVDLTASRVRHLAPDGTITSLLKGGVGDSNICGLTRLGAGDYVISGIATHSLYRLRLNP